MKKQFIIVALILSYGLCATAQKLEASKVPAPVKESFAKAYSKASSVKWEMEKGNYEAEFKQGEQEMAAVYTPAGVMTESEIAIKVSELPAAVTAYMKDHYKGVKIKEAAKITKANGEVNYEAEVSGKDVVFDASGKFLKEETD